MDLSNLITVSNYTMPEGAICNPVLNKITEVTGYQWNVYSPSVDIISNLSHPYNLSVSYLALS